MRWKTLHDVCMSRSGATETFPFEPGVSVFKAPGGKMFAVAAESSEPLDVTVKCDPEISEALRAEFKSIVPTASDKILEVITAGNADCGVDRSADPGLSTGTFTVLQDDKALVPNDVILPLISTDVGAADVLSVLDATSARLTTENLRLLMLRLNVDGASPEVVANEFTGNVGT